MNKYTDKCLCSIDTLKRMVLLENSRQIQKWGVQTRTAFEWVTYLAEEVGELAQAISEHEYRDGSTLAIVEEAVQVATLALKIAEMAGGITKKAVENETIF